MGIQLWCHNRSFSTATFFISGSLLWASEGFFLSVIFVVSGNECDSGVGRCTNWNDTTAAAWNISVFSLMNCSYWWLIKGRSDETWRNILWRESLKWMMLQPGGCSRWRRRRADEGSAFEVCDRPLLQNYSQWALIQDFAPMSFLLYREEKVTLKIFNNRQNEDASFPADLLFTHMNAS